MVTETLRREFRLTQDIITVLADAFKMPKDHPKRNLAEYGAYTENEIESRVVMMFVQLRRRVRGVEVQFIIERVRGVVRFEMYLDNTTIRDVRATAREMLNAVKRFYYPDKDTRVTWVTTSGTPAIEGRKPAEDTLYSYLDSPYDLFLAFYPNGIEVASNGPERVFITLTPA